MLQEYFIFGLNSGYLQATLDLRLISVRAEIVKVKALSTSALFRIQICVLLLTGVETAYYLNQQIVGMLQEYLNGLSYQTYIFLTKINDNYPQYLYFTNTYILLT